MIDFVAGAIFVCWGVGLVVSGACLCLCSPLRCLVFPGLVQFIEYEEWLACTMGTGVHVWFVMGILSILRHSSWAGCLHPVHVIWFPVSVLQMQQLVSH